MTRSSLNFQLRLISSLASAHGQDTSTFVIRAFMITGHLFSDLSCTAASLVSAAAHSPAADTENLLDQAAAALLAQARDCSSVFVVQHPLLLPPVAVYPVCT